MCPKTQNGKLDVSALLLPEVKELIELKDFTSLKDSINKLNSMDLAYGWSRFEPKERLIIFKLLNAKKAVEVFEDISFEERSYLINNLNNEEISYVVNEMAPDERAKLFKELSGKTMKKLLGLMKREEAANVERLLTYKENTAGGIMTTDFVEIKKDMTARKALLTLQENLTMGYAKDIHSAYVTSDERKLTGVVALQVLLKAPQDMLIKDIMSGAEWIKIGAGIDKIDIAKHFSRYDLLDAPVVDKEDRLLGIITIDDVVDLVERQTTSQIYEIGKMSSAGGELISYQTATIGGIVKRRAGWLMLLLVFDFLTGTVLKTFESSLSAVVALTFFIPMLLDTGGNAGAQTSITIIRGLATGDVSLKNVWRVVRLEILTAFVMAAIVSGVALARAELLQKDFFISIVVGATMFLIVIVAILTGLTLPILSKKLKLDPAALAGPITTSIVDVVGLIIYFKIAQIFIPVLRF